MIDRQGRRIVVECDSCEQTFESDEGDEFPSFWRAAKEAGWRSKRIGADWLHGCPRCGV